MNGSSVLTERVVTGIDRGVARLLPSHEAEAVRDAGTPVPGAGRLEVAARVRSLGIRTEGLQQEHN
jgi:hypothetical protein